LTAFLVVSLSERPDVPLSNPRIELRDGEMEVLGTYVTDAVSANVSIVMEVSVNEAGTPVIEVTSGSIGPLPVPAELLSGISDAVNQALTGEVSTTVTSFTLEQIVITEGEITLTGTVN
jgi:acetaldehyde dehydrogenase (acetylating)